MAQPTTKVCNGKLIFRRYRKNKKTGKQMDSYKYGYKGWPICLGTWEQNEKTDSTESV